MPEKIAFKENRVHYKHLFTDKHRDAWREVWKSVDGDLDRCASFAENSGIPSPVDFVSDLHKFLFWTWPGSVELNQRSEELTKQAQAFRNGFRSYLEKIAKDHLEEPEHTSWYWNKGFTKDGFVKALSLENVPYENDLDLIAFIDRRSPNFGRELYENFLLMNIAPAKKALAASTVAESLRTIAARIREEIGLQ